MNDSRIWRRSPGTVWISTYSPWTSIIQYAATYSGVPAAVDKVTKVAETIGTAYAYTAQKTQEGVEAVKKVTTVVLEGARILEEFVDVSNMGGTKDPLVSIDNSYKRILLKNESFAKLCDFFGNLAADYFRQNADSITASLAQLTRPTPVNENASIWSQAVTFVKSSLSFSLEGLLNFSQEILANTVKANLLNLFANLIDQTFQEKMDDPFKVLNLFEEIYLKYEERLKKISTNADAEIKKQYQPLFQEIANDVWKIITPKGSDDLLLFHHTIPVKAVKEQLYQLLQKALPNWLELLFYESRIIEQRHSDWEEAYNQKTNGLKAGQIVHVHSSIFSSLREKHPQLILDCCEHLVKNWIQRKKISKDLEEISRTLVLLLQSSVDKPHPFLVKIAFASESYIMKHLLVSLSKRELNKKSLDSVEQKSTFTRTVYDLTHPLFFQAITFLKEQKISYGEQLNNFFPEIILTKQQKENFDKEINEFLNHRDLITFYGDCLETFVLGVCTDLYAKYQSENAKAFPAICGPEGKKEEEEPLSFSCWLFQNLHDVFSPLSQATLSEEETTLLLTAISCKNSIGREAELEQLWPKIRPKFEQVTKSLLKILDYNQPEQLPLLRLLKRIMWGRVKGSLPKLLFKHTSDFFLPLLERRTLRKEVLKVPNGRLKQQGCELLAKDIMATLPNWLSRQMDQKTGAIALQISRLSLSKEPQDFLLANLTSFFKRENPLYLTFWQSCESYIEGVLLKVTLKLSSMQFTKIWHRLQSLAAETKKALYELDNRKDLLSNEMQSSNNNNISSIVTHAKKKESDILEHFTDQFFATLGIVTPFDLYALPPFLRHSILKEIKSRTAQKLLGIYRLENKIRQYKIPVGNSRLPKADVVRTTYNLTCRILNQTTTSLAQRAEGRMRGVTLMYTPLNTWLNQNENTYHTVDLLKDIIEAQNPTPFLEQFFQNLNVSQTEKAAVANWMTPLLAGQIIKLLSSLLDKEQQGGADFDQSLVMVLLPLIKQQLTRLNQKENHIHFRSSSEETKQFYRRQVNLIFAFFFPNGTTDLKMILEDFEPTQQQLDEIWAKASEQICLQLAKGLDSLFKKELLNEMYCDFLQKILQQLEQPAPNQNVPNPNSPNSQKPNEGSSSQMDALFGEILIEALRFIDLPIDRINKLPGWIKRVIHTKEIHQKAAESLGKAVRLKLNGEFFQVAIQNAFAQHASIERPTLPMDALERHVVEKGLTALFLSIGNGIWNATDVFNNRVLKKLHDMIFLVCSFVMVECIGMVLKFLRIKDFFVNRVHALVRYRREKIIHNFSRKELNESFFFHSVEAAESILMKANKKFS